MTAKIGMTIIGLLSVVANYVPLYIILPCRYSKRLSVFLTVLFVAAFYSVLFFTDTVTTTFNGLRGFLHIPMILLLFRGQPFQKIFAILLTMVFSGMLIFPARVIAGLITPVGSSEYYFLYIAILLAVYAIYILLMVKFGRRLFEKMFVTGRRVEWGIYSLGALFSLLTMATLQSVPIPVWLNIALLLFILWSFCVLCFAIINTHEKTKQKSDAEFARSIVASGRGHYQKMDEMYEKLRILSHDYKYHLNAVRKMISSGSLEEADRYLTGVENQLSEYELQSYSANSVLNALIDSYADRCAKLDIKLDVKLDIPEPLTVADYDMCIVLGNLLENAVEACEEQKSGRAVELVVKPQGTQLVIVTRNSFDGHIAQNEGTPVSAKKDGGLGLRSIQAVAARYGGELLTEWDNATFTAYVYMG